MVLIRPQPAIFQIVGGLGSGCRRMAFHFLSPVKRVAWIRSHWDLYAPSLWKLAKDYQIQEMIGIECSDRKKWRGLFRELLQSQALDAVVLDRLNLSAGEGFFLQQLLRPLTTKVLIIDAKPHSFCLKRVHLSLSHQSFRFFWSKGGSPTPRHLPFTYFQELDRLYAQPGGAPCTS